MGAGSRAKTLILQKTKLAGLLEQEWKTQKNTESCEKDMSFSHFQKKLVKVLGGKRKIGLSSDMTRARQ